MPFVGPAGRVLDRDLEKAGIPRAACLVTNVFMYHPPGNRLGYFFQKGKPDVSAWKHPKLGCVLPKWLPELERLKAELREFDPRLVVALGGTALWALTGLEGITKFRGCLVEGLLHSAPVLPTFHPSYVLRSGGRNGDFERDLRFVREYIGGEAQKEPPREIWIEPTIDDLWEFKRYYIDPSPILVPDIETAYKEPFQFIKCVGLAPDKDHALVVPFMDSRRPGGSYWRTVEEELEAERFLREVLGDPRTSKVNQNIPYDIQWLADQMEIYVRGLVDDTMVQAHVISPEEPRSLGVLATRYGVDRHAWKNMVTHGGREK